MKLAAFALYVLIALSGGPALAADAVVGASPGSRNVLDVFTQPERTAQAEAMVLGDIALPLPILASQAGYVKVALGGREVWLRSTQIRIKRDSVAGCIGPTTQFTPTGSIAGAGHDACK